MRRIIIGLSFPRMVSINHFTLSNQYLGAAYKLQYPTIGNITAGLTNLGSEALTYKTDLSKAFRQLYPLIP